MRSASTRVFILGWGLGEWVDLLMESTAVKADDDVSGGE